MLEKYKTEVVKKLKEYFEEYKKDSSYSSKIWDAMAYTTLLEGKRLRAVMCLETVNFLKGSVQEAIPSACALEIMHAYSLIHDDLPCMDNDDLRRGKPSNHKVFGEAAAVLAGDALIPFGAQIIIEKTPSSVKKETILSIVDDYLKTAGALGIVAGQIADIEAENKQIDFENLKYIHKYKTGALFNCSMTMGAKIAGADRVILSKIKEYADNFGILFQIYDDIIDCTLTTDEIGKTAGKDKASNKLTYVSAFGLDGAKSKFVDLINKNHDILKELNINSNVFSQIEDSLLKRIK